MCLANKAKANPGKAADKKEKNDAKRESGSQKVKKQSKIITSKRTFSEILLCWYNVFFHVLSLTTSLSRLKSPTSATSILF
jgi:hypothetical protein